MKNLLFRGGVALLMFFVGVLLNALQANRNSVPNVVQSPSGVTKVVEKDEFASLFYDLRTDEIPKRNAAIKRIWEIGDTSAEHRSGIVKAMTVETAKLCAARDLSPADFDELALLSRIFAEWRAIEPLDLLIDCSNKSSDINYKSLPNYATFPGIIAYRQSAIPTLERKLNALETPNGVKYQIISALGVIGGKKARRILINAAKIETDETLSEHLRHVVEASVDQRNYEKTDSEISKIVE